MPRPEPPLLRVGERLGAYRIDRLLGTGGQAQVFSATDKFLRRKAAIKIVKDRDHRAGLREARVIASLDHPHIVRVYQVERTEDGWYMAMEYMAGGSCSELLDRGRLDYAEAVRMGIEIADALEYAHAAGVVHRDVKPHNVLLTPAGATKLSDFGLATHGSGETSESKRGIGTPLFMAPEVWRGELSGPPSDIYSLGACLYLMFTGRTPFRNPRTDKLRQAHLRDQPPKMSDVPSACSALVLKCLAKSADARPTAAVVRAELAKLLTVPSAGEAPAGLPPSLDFERLVEVLNSIETFQRTTAWLEAAMARSTPGLLVLGNCGVSIQALVQQTLATAPHVDEVFRMLLDEQTDLPERMRGFQARCVERHGLLHMHLTRDLTTSECDQFFSMVNHKSGCRAVVTGNPSCLDRLWRDVVVSGRQALVQRHGVDALSDEERGTYIEGWATALGFDIRFWTPDVLLLLAAFEREQTFERSVHNALMLAHFVNQKVLTTWTVWGGNAHDDWLSGTDAVLPEWRERPRVWPDAFHLRRLQELRRMTQRLRTEDSGWWR